MKKIIISLAIACIAILSATIGIYYSSSLQLANLSYSGELMLAGSEAYLVSLTSSRSPLAAETLANDYSNERASGYIWQQDEYYHVIHSAFEKENDAILVKQTLGFGEIIKVQFNPSKIEIELSQQKMSALNQAHSVFMIAFRTMTDSWVGKETGVYTDVEISNKLKKLSSKVETAIDEFWQEFSNESNNRIVELGEYLADLSECIALCQKDNKPKFHAVEILHIFKNLTCELN